MRLVAGSPPRRPGFEVRSFGICVEQSGTGAVFLRVLRFPLPIIPLTAPLSSSSIIREWCSRPNSGQHNQVDCLTPSQETKRHLPPPSPVEKLQYVLNSKNVHLSNYFSITLSQNWVFSSRAYSKWCGIYLRGSLSTC
jgi:hypothetical protein